MKKVFLALAFASFIVGNRPAFGQDAIDLSKVIVHNSPATIAAWPVTETITGLTMARPAGLSFAFKPTPPEKWKFFTGNGDDNYQYTVWACLDIHGLWHCSGFIQMWQGRESTGAPILTDFATNWAYDAPRWGEMAGYEPTPGEVMAFFVSAGNARGQTDVTSVRERSNVITVALPPQDNGTFVFELPSNPPEPPVVVTPPEPALKQLAVDIAALHAEVIAGFAATNAHIDQVVKNAEQSAPGFISQLVHAITLGLVK